MGVLFTNSNYNENAALSNKGMSWFRYLHKHLQYQSNDVLPQQLYKVQQVQDFKLVFSMNASFSFVLCEFIL